MIKKFTAILLLLFFTHSAMGMKKSNIRKRSPLRVTFAEEENNQTKNATPIFFSEPKKKIENGPCPPLFCIFCSNCMVAGACSLALAAVVYFADPEAVSQPYEYVNKTT